MLVDLLLIRSSNILGGEDSLVIPLARVEQLSLKLV